MISTGAATTELGFIHRSVDRLSYSLFLCWSLDRLFIFDLAILDQIELPTAAVIQRFYSDNGIDSASAASSTSAITADSLAS
jgi:hypothetical protein